MSSQGRDHKAKRKKEKEREQRMQREQRQKRKRGGKGCPLFELRPDTVAHVCGYLEPVEILTSLFHCSKQIISFLTPKCLGHLPIDLGSTEIASLYVLPLPVSSPTFRSRSDLLASAELMLSLNTLEVDVSHVLVALSHFPNFQSLTLNGCGRHILTDSNLDALLRLPALQRCTYLVIGNFLKRRKGEVDEEDEEDEQEDEKEYAIANVEEDEEGDGSENGEDHGREDVEDGEEEGEEERKEEEEDEEDEDEYEDETDRKDNNKDEQGLPLQMNEEKALEKVDEFQVNWANVCLPALTGLELWVSGATENVYIGGADFLVAHPDLLELSLTPLLVPVAELTKLFGDPQVLPRLSGLQLNSHRRRGIPLLDLTPLFTALATTTVNPHNDSHSPSKVRPLREFVTNLPCHPISLGPAMSLPHLAELSCVSMGSGWLSHLLSLTGSTFVTPRLEHLNLGLVYFASDQRDYGDSPRDISILPLLQLLTRHPLKTLILEPGEPTALDAATITKLAELTSLETLRFSQGISDEELWLDCNDPAPFAALHPNSLQNLVNLEMIAVKISAATIRVLGMTAPNLREVELRAQLNCHPGIICAIIGATCSQIQTLEVNDSCCHTWKNVQAEAINNAYSEIVRAVQRPSDYEPFTQLQQLNIVMCWCSSPVAWHATMRLFRGAKKIKHLDSFASHDHLIIASLAYFPQLSSLSAECLWTDAFGLFLQRKVKGSKKHRYIVAQIVWSYERGGCPRNKGYVRLSDSPESGEMGAPVLLRPHAAGKLFPRYIKTLSQDQQAALARWRRGEFKEGDEQVVAPESEVEPHEDEKDAVHRHCPHSHFFRTVVPRGVEENEDKEVDQ